MSGGTHIPILNVSNHVHKNFRGNYCSRQAQFLNNTVTLNRALSGRTVSVGINDFHGSNPFFMQVNSSTGFPYSGYNFDIWTQLAELGQFKIQFVQVPHLTTTYDALLTQTTPFVDMYGASWYSDTTERRIEGIGFTSTIVDASLVFITSQQMESKVDMCVLFQK